MNYELSWVELTVSACAGMGASWLHPRFPINSGLGRQKSKTAEGWEGATNLCGPLPFPGPCPHCHCQPGLGFLG